MKYTVHHAFGHDGVLYTNDNADQISSLPPEVIQQQMERRHVSAAPDEEVHPQRAAHPAPALESDPDPDPETEE
jgi:hypothetical protein